MTNYREILDRALASPKGLRVEFTTRDQAIRFRDRCNKLRASDRKTNARANDKHPDEGTSQFDGLVLRLEKPDEVALLIEHDGALEPIAIAEITAYFQHHKDCKDPHCVNGVHRVPIDCPR